MRRLLLRNDIGRLTAYLMQEETANTFLLGNLLYFGVEDDRRTFRRGEYWGFFKDGELAGVVALFNNSQCMVYHTDESVIREMAAQISESGMRLVLGGDRSVRPMVPLLRGVPGRMVVHSQLFMSQEAGASPHSVSFAPDSQAFEFEDARSRGNSRAVQDFIMRCMLDGFGYNVSRSTVKRLLREKTEYEHYLLLRAQGKYVAQAHIQCRTPDYCQIGGVCTLPEERRKGYAKAVVERMAGLIPQDGGRRACLVVNLDNEAAQNLYISLGFRETGRLMLIDFL